MKWNESGFRPPLCTYRLNWARRTSWGWWDEWDDTVLQTHDSKFKPWRSEAEHATSRSRRLPTILSFTREWGRNIFVSFKPPRPGTEPRTLAWKAAELQQIGLVVRFFPIWICISLQGPTCFRCCYLTSPPKSSKCYDDVKKTQYWLNVGPPLPALAQQFTLNEFDFYVAAFFWERLY